MNIYKLERKITGYDQYSAFLCYANSAEEALEMSPAGLQDGDPFGWEPEEAIATYIGSNPDVEETSVILASYHAG